MHTILQYAKQICDDNVELKNFCQFNANGKNNNLKPTTTTASSLISETDFKGSPETSPIVAAIKKHVGEANWRQTYSISEVGEDFANRHCYFELIGPKGHFYDEKIRVFIF